MFKKTFSQKAARIFEIVSYILLVPAVLSLIFPFFIALAGLSDLHSGVFLFALLPFLIFGIGIVLLCGYIKHSRGTLGEEKIIPLWGATLFFNGLPLLPVFYQIATTTPELNKLSLEEISNPVTLFGFLLILWWIIAAALSITAISDEFRSGKNLL